ncbi:MAG: hypothetical protein J5517_05815 [Eubacterium sp.]|nr:hypothetical protein [Eubacterium sp.]
MDAVTREEKLLDGQDLEPITRKEQFIKKIYDNTQVTPEPITREEYFLKKAGESGGGGSVTVEQLRVTENGEYSESGKAYSPVIVEVPTPPPTPVPTYKVATGTFTSASEQYGIVDIDCGFEPDMVFVSLPFGENDTSSYWERNASWGDEYACWNLLPAEYGQYMVALNRDSGETGIQAINSDGFSFMSNAWNTQGVTCTYTAVKYEEE